MIWPFRVNKRRLVIERLARLYNYHDEYSQPPAYANCGRVMADYLYGTNTVEHYDARWRVAARLNRVKNRV